MLLPTTAKTRIIKLFAFAAFFFAFDGNADAATTQTACGTRGTLRISANAARIGQQVSILIEGPANAPLALVASFDPGPTMTPAGLVCVSTDPNPPARFRILINSLQGPGPRLDSNGFFQLVRTVPNDPALLGTSLYLQAATRSGNIVLSNGLTLVFGRSANHGLLPTGLGANRALPTATKLSDGNVLIAGGGAGTISAPQATATSDLYCTASKRVLLVGSMSAPRALHAAALLPSGRILICGGVDTTRAVHTSAEEYDPITQTYSPVGSMNTPRASHTATVLSNGQILIIGGSSNFAAPVNVFQSAQATAEIYNPTTQTFSSVTSFLDESRVLHSATVLADGRVLVAGGIQGANQQFGLPVLALNGELFDPTVGTFSSIGRLQTTRAAHAAARMQDGRVLLAGGFAFNTQAQSAAEIYTPGAGFSTAGILPEPKSSLTMVLLDDGRILETGGFGGFLIAPTGLASSSLFDPQTESFTPTGDLSIPRGGHSMIVLSDGSVLSIGGAEDDSTVHNSIDRYYP